MKRAALLLTLLLSTSAHATEPYYYPETQLGQPVQIGGLWYVPVLINNPGLWNIHNFWGWGDTDADLAFTGTLRPASIQQGEQGHLPGNYWPYFVGASITRNWGGDSTTAYGKWKVAAYGAFDPVFGGGGDCESIPSLTSGILCYLHLVGTGTVRLTRPYMWSSDGCPGPIYYNYLWMANGTQAVYLDTEPPVCMDCGGEGGGGDDTREHLKAGADVKEVKAAKRTTWGSIKKFYR
jgi:hypothetical protein